MKAKLLASATQRSAVMERMQNVASTSAAATKPIPSMTDRSLIRRSLRLRDSAKMHAAGSHSSSHRARLAELSDPGTATLGLARQLSGTGAARLTDVCITAGRGSVSHACVPRSARKSKTFQKIGRLFAPLRATSVAKKPDGTFEPLASIERQNLMQVRLHSLCADNAQQDGARP
jgi:hypothetical protein